MAHAAEIEIPFLVVKGRPSESSKDTESYVASSQSKIFQMQSNEASLCNSVVKNPELNEKRTAPSSKTHQVRKPANVEQDTPWMTVQRPWITGTQNLERDNTMEEMADIKPSSIALGFWMTQNVRSDPYNAIGAVRYSGDTPVGLNELKLEAAGTLSTAGATEGCNQSEGADCPKHRVKRSSGPKL